MDPHPLQYFGRILVLFLFISVFCLFVQLLVVCVLDFLACLNPTTEHEFACVTVLGIPHSYRKLILTAPKIVYNICPIHIQP